MSVWQGDGWELRQGDVLRLLLGVEASSVDGVVTDCPYSSGGATRGDRTQSTSQKYINSDSGNRGRLADFLGDNRDQRSFGHWCALWYADLWRATRDGGVILSFTDWRQLPATTDAMQAGGWVWRAIVPWNKTEATRPQLGRPRAQCEYVVFGTKGPHKAWEGAPALPGFYTVPAPRERVHITEKPVPLLTELLQMVPPGGLVLDPFCGSGSTGVAALRRERRVLLFELSEGIATQAAARMSAAGQGLTAGEMLAGQGSLFGGAA